MASAAIHSLIEALDAKGLEAYLSENDVDLDEVRFDNGNCPLQKAAELGYYDGVEALLEYQEDIVDDFNADGENALHVAIRQKNARIAQLLLDVDIDLNALVKPPSMDEGLSPLSLAIKSDSLDIVKMLLKAGADVNAGTSLGVLATPLHTAAHFGNQTAIEMLVKHDADPLLLNNLKMAPLHIVAAKGYVGAVEALLPRSTNVLNVQDVYGDSPLHLAVQAQCQRLFNYNYPLEDFHMQIAFMLLTHGANVSLRNKEGDTPLDIINPDLADLFDIIVARKENFLSISKFVGALKLNETQLTGLGLDPLQASVYTTKAEAASKLLAIEPTNEPGACSYIDSSKIATIRKFQHIDRSKLPASSKGPETCPMGFSSANENGRPTGKCPMGFGSQDDSDTKSQEPLSWAQWLKQRFTMKFSSRSGRTELIAWVVVGAAVVLAVRKSVGVNEPAGNGL